MPKQYHSLFISTDSNEVKGILEHKGGEYIRSYDFSKDRVQLNGNLLLITNLPISMGQGIQDTYGLEFNPMSVINAEMRERDVAKLVKKLVKENGLWVSELNGREIKNYFPDRRH